MATTTVEADLQGAVYKNYSNILVNWLTEVRDSSTGSTAATYTTSTNASNAIEAAFISGRGGYQGRCNRTFLFFDVSSITGTDTITAATLKVRGGGFSTNADTIAVEATAWGEDGTTTSLATSDYPNIDHDLSYSPELTTWTSSGYNDYTLNSSAISAMNTDGYLNCAILEHDYDYNGVGPSVGTSATAGVSFLHSTDKIKIVITHSSSGYGNEVIGVASANIGTVIGVATGNIGTVIGVQ